MTTPYADREVWFLTGSQHLYGPEVLDQVAAQSQEIARALDAADAVPAPVVWKPVLADSTTIRRVMLEANADDRVLGVVTWMHTFSPSKMWIAGLDALRKPLLHLHTQANVEPAVGDDRLRLHEPQPGRARRPRARVRARAHEHDPHHRGRPRLRPVRARPRGHLGAGRRRVGRAARACGWPGSATTCATSR
ncbi:hypothetical protein GCM10025868_00860 [Angustibacter aerolatus]|uniref:L-arabinose isomerase N-terminal domain-containing protein n=1 Tax=Angustibacter aerolatus TaxID=1162965 RepID=A0ABQ6J9I2_9ACTN|nr:hypothetical protein [Angustibacter aerolatus]GMA84836.1 hypothetical protein GCM10025868_00860 [Angustibacter aerolatus]